MTQIIEYRRKYRKNDAKTRRGGANIGKTTQKLTVVAQISKYRRKSVHKDVIPNPEPPPKFKRSDHYDRMDERQGEADPMEVPVFTYHENHTGCANSILFIWGVYDCTIDRI